MATKLETLLSALRNSRSPVTRQKLAEEIRIFRYKVHQSITPSGRVIRR